MDPALDRSSKKPVCNSNSSNVIKAFMGEYGISDPWTFLYPTSKTFSFFFPVHHTFSHIDFFLLDKKLLPQLRAVSYYAIVISDHAPVTLELSFPDKPNSRCPWHFNPLLLSDEAFTNHIASEIHLFVSTNVTPGVSASLVWETFKAYIRAKL